MTTRLILVSHALTQWNMEGRIQGHTDVPLNSRGRRMAECLAHYLADETIHAVYTSDLKRAYQTGQPTADLKQLPVQQDSRLREGRSRNQERSSVYPTLPYAMEVETPADVLERMNRALTDISLSHDGQTVLVVSHHGALEIFIEARLKESGEKQLKYKGIRMALNRIHYNTGQWQCIGLNEADFFDAEPAGQSHVDFQDE